MLPNNSMQQTALAPLLMLSVRHSTMTRMERYKRVEDE
jgi:hypothetical protein